MIRRNNIGTSVVRLERYKTSLGAAIDAGKTICSLLHGRYEDVVGAVRLLQEEEHEGENRGVGSATNPGQNHAVEQKIDQKEGRQCKSQKIHQRSSTAWR